MERSQFLLSKESREFVSLLNAIMIFEHLFPLKRICDYSVSKLANVGNHADWHIGTLLHGYLGNYGTENFEFPSPHPSRVLTG